MHAPLNPFLKQATASRRLESVFCWILRLATYLVLLVATYLFATISIKGGSYVFQPKNLPFLYDSPESLHIAKIEPQDIRITAKALTDIERFTKNLSFNETGRTTEVIHEFVLPQAFSQSLQDTKVELNTSTYERVRKNAGEAAEMQEADETVISFGWEGKQYVILKSEYGAFLKKVLSADSQSAREEFEKKLTDKQESEMKLSKVKFLNNSGELNSNVTLTVAARDQFLSNPLGVILPRGEREEIYVSGRVGAQELKMGDRAYRTLTALNPEFKTLSYKSQVYAAGGIFPNIVGTILLTAGSIAIALTLGILSAVYLSEYSRKGTMIELIRLAIMNLSGVPSIVFGMFGYGMFVILFGWNTSLMAGWFTLAFMVLPVIITASEESLRAVPQGFREGSLALGATKWQSINKNVLPYALPGILTSSVLGIARVAGETAPIMFTAAFVVRDELPWQVQNFTDFFFQGVMALPYHIYVVSAKVPQNEYTEEIQYACAFVFLFLVMMIALASIILRSRLRSKLKW